MSLPAWFTALAVLPMTPDSSLQRIIKYGDDPSADATLALAFLAWEFSEDKWLRNGILSGIGGREPAFLRELLSVRPADAKVGAGMALCSSSAKAPCKCSITASLGRSRCSLLQALVACSTYMAPLVTTRFATHIAARSAPVPSATRYM